ncbi:MAG: flavin reductase family protein [Ignavibacteriae bacterium]|nr:flavin reductase family protein [Ignavibacteriota bacterium]
MKQSISKKTIVYPHPVFVIGSYDIDGLPNIMTASWSGICCSEPPCIAVSLRKSRYSYENILFNKAFTVNIPSEDYVQQVDYIGIYSGKYVNKFQKTGLTPLDSNTVKAPYVKEFPVSLHCELLKTVEIGIHTQFIGEIMDVLVDEEVMNLDGTLMIEKIKPYIYDSSTRAYYGFGRRLIDAFKAK